MTDTRAMVPTAKWYDGLRAFADEAELARGNAGQMFLCMTCVRGGTDMAPRTIVMVSGTSYCAEHASTA